MMLAIASGQFFAPSSISMHWHLANRVIGRRPFATFWKASPDQNERYHLCTATTRREILVEHLRSGVASLDSSQSSVMPSLQQYRPFERNSLQRKNYQLWMTGSH
jgi:hypothetical protein